MNSQSFNEFKRERVKLAANKHDIDVIILSLPENIKYFSGFFPAGMSMLQSSEAYLVYRVKDGQMALITSAADTPTILESGYMGDIKPLGNFQFAIPGDDKMSKEIDKILSTRFEDIAETLCSTILDMCPDVKRIFVDELRMSIPTWKKINDRLDNVCFFDEVNVIGEIRKVKHSSEIELLKKSANIAEDALMAAISQITIGMSEYDIEMNFRREALKRDGLPYFCVATIDKRAAFSDTINQKFSKVQKGSMIRFDFGVIHEGYRSDLARTVVISENLKAERYYEAILEGEEKAVEAIKPGITAGEVFDIAVETTRKAGIPHYKRHHVGHGIGIEIYDFPTITPNNSTVLEEGMVFCIETPYYEIGWGGVQVEDTIVITSSGAEYLSESPRTLIKLDL